MLAHSLISVLWRERQLHFWKFKITLDCTESSSLARVSSKTLFQKQNKAKSTGVLINLVLVSASAPDSALVPALTWATLRFTFRVPSLATLSAHFSWLGTTLLSERYTCLNNTQTPQSLIMGSRKSETPVFKPCKALCMMLAIYRNAVIINFIHDAKEESLKQRQVRHHARTNSYWHLDWFSLTLIPETVVYTAALFLNVQSKPQSLNGKQSTSWGHRESTAAWVTRTQAYSKEVNACKAQQVFLVSANEVNKSTLKYLAILPLLSQVCHYRLHWLYISMWHSMCWHLSPSNQDLFCFPSALPLSYTSLLQIYFSFLCQIFHMHTHTLYIYIYA